MYKPTDRFQNWFVTKLATNITDDQTTIVLGNELFVKGGHLVINPYDEENREILKVTALHGTAIDVLRGQDNTVPNYHLKDTIVAMEVVAADLNQLYEEWAASVPIPGGGTTGQALLKVSDADGDVEWGEVASPLGINNLVPKEVPTGTKNGVNTSFFTSQPYVAGSLIVYRNGAGEGFMVTETNPLTGEFSLDAPLSTDDLWVSYQYSENVTGNADTVDNYHANATPTANNIPVLDSSAKLPEAATRLPAISRHNNGSSISLSDAKIEVGWGWMQFSSSTTQISESISFNTSFSSAPIVLATAGGDAGNVPAVYGTGGANIHGNQTIKTYNITNTGFGVTLSSTGTYTSGQTVYYQWVAIGS